MIEVKSSHMKKVGYDPGKGVLQILFNNDALYRYYPVPKTEYERFIEAPSLGHYFSKWIKTNHNYKVVQLAYDPNDPDLD